MDDDFAFFNAATCSRWSVRIASLENCGPNSRGAALMKVASLFFAKESKSLLYSSSSFCLRRPDIWEDALPRRVTADSTAYQASSAEISFSLELNFSNKSVRGQMALMLGLDHESRLCHSSLCFSSTD